MIVWAIFSTAVAALCLYSMSHLLRENRRLRDRIADHVFRESVNRDTAQGILDNLRAREGEVLELTEDMRICEIERDQTEALYLRARKRTGVWL